MVMIFNILLSGIGKIFFFLNLKNIPAAKNNPRNIILNKTESSTKDICSFLSITAVLTMLCQNKINIHTANIHNTNHFAAFSPISLTRSITLLFFIKTPFQLFIFQASFLYIGMRLPPPALLLSPAIFLFHLWFLYEYFCGVFSC